MGPWFVRIFLSLVLVQPGCLPGVSSSRLTLNEDSRTNSKKMGQSSRNQKSLLTRKEMAHRLEVYNGYVDQIRRATESLNAQVVQMQNDTAVVMQDLNGIMSVASTENSTIMEVEQTVAKLQKANETVPDTIHRQDANITALHDYVTQEIEPIMKRKIEFEDFSKQLAYATGTMKAIQPRIASLDGQLNDIEFVLQNQTESVGIATSRVLDGHLQDTNKLWREDLKRMTEKHYGTRVP